MPRGLLPDSLIEVRQIEDFILRKIETVCGCGCLFGIALFSYNSKKENLHRCKFSNDILVGSLKMYQIPCKNEFKIGCLSTL